MVFGFTTMTIQEMNPARPGFSSFEVFIAKQMKRDSLMGWEVWKLLILTSPAVIYLWYYKTLHSSEFTGKINKLSW